MGAGRRIKPIITLACAGVAGFGTRAFGQISVKNPSFNHRSPAGTSTTAMP